MQQLRRQFDTDTRGPRPDAVAAVNASYLAACASAAIARTESAVTVPDRSFAVPLSVSIASNRSSSVAVSTFASATPSFVHPPVAWRVKEQRSAGTAPRRDCPWGETAPTPMTISIAMVS